MTHDVTLIGHTVAHLGRRHTPHCSICGPLVERPTDRETAIEVKRRHELKHRLVVVP